MNFFNTSFYNDSLALNQNLKALKFQETSYPELKYIYDNDKFWRELWKDIDEAKVTLT